MKIRFLKDIEVQYWDSRYNESNDKIFRRGATVEIADVETIDKSHVNLHFENADLAIDVPVSSFVSVG
jgi:hypothetical protein